MKRHPNTIAASLWFVTSLALVCSSWAEASKGTGIGLYTEVQGSVSVMHLGDPTTYDVKVRDGVIFKDVVETRVESKGQALFLDDSLLTLGPESRVEVNEYIYDPNRDYRSTIMKLAQGKVRALVSRIFAGGGSRFEVHTPTAVVASRGTYFVVWVDDPPAKGKSIGASGVANIGDSGAVEFTSGGKTVIIRPGQFSIAEAGKAPSDPAIITPQVPTQVTVAINATDINYGLNPETAKQILYNTAKAVDSPSGASTAPANGPLSTILKNSSLSSATDGIKNKLSATSTSGELQAAKEAISGAADKVTKTLNGVAGTLGETTSTVVDGVRSTVGGTLDGIRPTVGGAVGDLGGTVAGTVGKLSDTVGSAVDTVSGVVGVTVPGALTTLGGTVGTVGSTVGGTVGTVGSTVGGTVGTVGSTVGGTVGTVGSTVGGTVGTVGSTVGGTVGTLP